MSFIGRHAIEFDGRRWVSDEAHKNELRHAFVAGFSTARPVPEPPHRHSDEDCELMEQAFPFDFPLSS